MYLARLKAARCKNSEAPGLSIVESLTLNLIKLQCTALVSYGKPPLNWWRPVGSKPVQLGMRHEATASRLSRNPETEAPCHTVAVG